MAQDRDNAASFAANQRLWEAWTAIHAEGDFYDLAGFRRGGIRLRDEEIAAVGEVRGRTLLHLQCHFGIDTLSWARLGARVTGADFSPAAIRLAREIAADIGIEDATFVESNLYELPRHLDGQFDVVYTSRGALNWLPDIRGWARVAAHFVAPGGTFFITEAHPVFNAFENEGVGPRELRLTYPYWEHLDPLVFDVKGSYADPEAEVGDQKEHGWDHGLGEIVTALIDAGLRIESLAEHPYLEWAADFLVESEPGSGRFVLPPGSGELPLSFSLRATKPAAS
jgi:ubiquinone/menaquinone biosynthesis C-methylase UbiE